MASLTNMDAEPRLHDAHPGPGRRTDRAASHVYPAVKLSDVKVADNQNRLLEQQRLVRAKAIRARHAEQNPAN